ncbi:Eco57I restriction-modification methylase domain-containing protein [Actinomadura luteofluorescens]|uniref:Eco57I restriction-modification methylase domain-containing protein n=1 Tax=Actinomadura luteofluorescens TaxID=46163 RepID=UPI003499F1C0
MSATARTQIFSSVHTIGGLLPADMLVRISEGKDVPGSKPADYDIFGSRSVPDEAERHWDYLKSVWKDLRGKLPVAPEAETPADPTGLAIRQWLEPLFAELNFGRLTALGASGIEADDGTKTFAISHLWTHVPIHLTAWNTRLDTRPGGPGTIPPQSLMQECLNRTDAHLWAVLTNGRQLRLLRDSSALATAAYVEFDLEAIFDGELFSEFVLLYRLLHASRFAVDDGTPPSSCWLEKWRTDAIASGTRALDQLRKGVQEAITTLGTGFLKHPANAELRENIDTQAMHKALLRLVYRLLFLFVIEDRDVLHLPEASEQARKRYEKYFSSARLRGHSRRRRGTAHGDLYQALKIVLDALGDEAGRPELGIPGLGGLFSDTDTDAPLRGLSLSNEHLLTAVRHLSQVRDPSTRRWRAVDYNHLGAEELGSIYESLLELVPKHSAVDRTFELAELAGNTRKTTGSYYTPSSLIDCLLDATLDPVIDDAQKRGEEKATANGEPDATEAIVSELLSLTVCDPACGSGHFLVAAARRIAKRVAAVRERNPEPTLDAVRRALHEVIAQCVYGVDINPMAVELAKVSLWLEAMDPGKPLGFLDAHIKHGNALIGATPTLLKNGIPDEAFIPTEGDDKKQAKILEKLNVEERSGQYTLFDSDEETVKVTNIAFAAGLRRIITAPSDNLRAVKRQAEAYEEWEKSAEYIRALHVADAWCSAFMWLKTEDSPRAVTQKIFLALEDPDAEGIAASTHKEVVRLRDQYRFFHWHLEFPEVFTVPDDGQAATINPATGWAGGFSCVLGNPPWDSVELKEQEFFEQRASFIAKVSKADARKKLITALQNSPDTLPLYSEYAAAKRTIYAESHFLRRSGRVPLTGQGNLNRYSVFAETDRILISPYGRAGIIVPTGIATDARTQYFFNDLVQQGSISTLYDFENAAPLFPSVHRSFKFSVLSIAGSNRRERAAKFAFFLHNPAELDDAGRTFALTPEEIRLLNPNTGTCPIFRSRRDATITLEIYRQIPILAKHGDPHGKPWNASLTTMFHMAHEAHLFHDRKELLSNDWSLNGNVFHKDGARMLPLYEAKMLHQYDHRWVTYDIRGKLRDITIEERQQADTVALPRYWVAEQAVNQAITTKAWQREWIIGFRKICRSTDERTVIAYTFPKGGLGDSGNIIMPLARESSPALLYANLIAFVLDYTLRQKLGGTNLNFFQFEQLPIATPTTLELHKEFIGSRVLELTYTAVDMAPFARDLGDSGEPFIWHEERRAVIRAELDALFFHLYGISREDVDYIMDTFPIVKRKDEAKYGKYRTKDLVLAEYDRMAAVGVDLDRPLLDGENYTSTLTPPPGHGPRHGEQRSR